MTFIDDIFSFVWDISDFFYNAFLEVAGWVWPFKLLATHLYSLHLAFWYMLTPIAHFGDWVSDVATKVANILSGTDIISLLRTWLTYAEDAWSWVANAWWNIWSTIVDWWKTVTPIVQGWIGIATQGLPELLVAWKLFWIINWPQVVSLATLAIWWDTQLLAIGKLLDTAFTTRQSLWSGWQEIKAQVIEFFTDPVEFIWEKFTDWFLGPEVKQ